MENFVKAVQGNYTVAVDTGDSNTNKALELLREGKF